MTPEPPPEPGLPGRAPSRRRRRTFWFPALAIAIGVHGAAFFALGVTSGHGEPHAMASLRTRWVGERADEAIELRDPKSLFLPTKRNASAREVTALEARGPGEIFGLEERIPLIAKEATPAALAASPRAVPTASSTLARFSRDYFSALGQQDEIVQPLVPRAAGLEVRSAVTGELVFSTELSLTALGVAGADAKRWPFWAPFEAVISIEPTGSVGLPLISAPGSGAEVVDEFFRAHLQALLKPHLVLPAGYYRVAIGP